MHKAFELPTPQVPGTTRRAYRLDPPYSYETYDPDAEAVVTATVEYVVISRIPIEVMAFPGRVVRNILGRERVEITEMSEAAAVKGLHRIRYLLTLMGYRAVTGLNGITTVKHEDGRTEHQGRWGQGGPGSDDYMSFGS